MQCKSHHHTMQSSRLTFERSPQSVKGWLRSETVAGWKTDVVPKAWRLLEHTLDRHDSASIGWKYRKVRSRINGVSSTDINILVLGLLGAYHGLGPKRRTSNVADDILPRSRTGVSYPNLPTVSPDNDGP